MPPLSIIQRPFSDIRRAYEEVLAFLATRHITVHHLNEKIEGDYGWSGDDNYELLSDFVDEFHLDHAGFDYSEYFASEAELTGGLQGLFVVVSLPYLIFGFLLDHCFAIRLPGFATECGSSRKDLTVGDLMAWRLHRAFTTRRASVIVVE